MRKTVFMVLVALAVLAAAACSNNPTVPGAISHTRVGTVSTGSGTTTTIIKVEDLLGTWQATKAEAWNFEDPNIRRDLVGEGGTITLVLETNQAYTVTVTMPGETPRVDTGRWYYSEYSGGPQIDFYPSSLPVPEYGEVPAFEIILSGNILSLSGGLVNFLPFDFGWHDMFGKNWGGLNLVVARQ